MLSTARLLCQKGRWVVVLNGFTIRQCLPATGDWYLVSDKFGDDVWFIERVVLWAVGIAPQEVEHVRAVGGDGLPHECHGDWYFVYGPDESSFGGTWEEVYQEGIILGPAPFRRIATKERRRSVSKRRKG
jgi:hypothetical protein